jgi:hypothetical protein
MRVIALSASLLLLLAAQAMPDAHDDVIEVFSKMAAALSSDLDQPGGARGGNPDEFMSAISKDMPDYDTLKANVNALVRDAEVTSSILPLSEDDQGEVFKIDLDWFLQIRSLEQDGPIVRRREVVHCELRKEKKHWKVTSLKPVDFFAAEKLGAGAGQ